VENRPLDYEEIKELIHSLAQDLEIDLSEEQISRLARFWKNSITWK